MFDRGNLSLFPHIFKYAGILIAALALLVWLYVYNLVAPEVITTSTKTDKETLLKLINWIGVIGLFMIAFSREKKEDEHVQLIRNTIMRGSFKLMFSFIVAVQLPFSFFIEKSIAFTPFLIATFYLLLYIIQFQYCLYFTPKYIYEQNPDRLQPFKSKVMTGVWTFLSIAMAVMLIITVVGII